MRDDETGNQIFPFASSMNRIFLLIQFWHNDVNIWKTMTSNTPSSLPIGANNEYIETIEQQIPLRNRNKSLARKFRNLQEFATASNLNLSNNDDRLLQIDTAQENVQCMANDLITSI
jgi:hypothetical protein